MRKIPLETREFHKRRQLALRRKQQRAANRRRHPPQHSKEYKQKRQEYLLLRNKRQEFYQEFYRKRSYNQRRKIVNIGQEFGIEEDGGIDYFLQKANEIIDFRSRQLLINIKECSRVFRGAFNRGIVGRIHQGIC